MIRWSDLVRADRAPADATPAERSPMEAHRVDHEIGASRRDRFTATLLNRRRAPFVQATRRNFLRGSLTAASTAAAAAAVAVGPTRRVAAQTSTRTSGQFPYRILHGCDPSHAAHDCRPGCGETPTCNHLGCCTAEGWFRNEPDFGFKLLDTSYCAVSGAPVFGDGWLWEYRPDLDGKDANGPCVHCTRLVFRCHDGLWYNPQSAVWEPMICRAEVECDPSGREAVVAQATPIPPTPAPIPTPEPLAAIGAIDAITDDSGGQITVVGWAIAGDSTEPIDVAIEVDGEQRFIGPASLARRDVQQQESSAGCCHGFAAVITDVASGRHVVTVRARRGERSGLISSVELDVAASAPARLQAGTVNGLALTGTATIPRTEDLPTRSGPIGQLDSLLAGRIGGAFAAGWVGDRDSSRGAYVVATVDGVDSAASKATLARPDVASSLPHLGLVTGFTLEIPWVESGEHEVCIWAVDPHNGDRALLGCKPILAPATRDDITPPLVPIGAGTLPTASGSLDDLGAQNPGRSSGILGAVDVAISVLGGRLTVRGWCCDLADRDTPQRIGILIDGKSEGTGTANLPRRDIGRVLGSDDHGFTITVPAKSGPASVEVWALDGGDTPQAMLGYLTVTVL